VARVSWIENISSTVIRVPKNPKNANELMSSLAARGQNRLVRALLEWLARCCERGAADAEMFCHRDLWRRAFAHDADTSFTAANSA
jgi:hypothetical protein